MKNHVNGNVFSVKRKAANTSMTQMSLSGKKFKAVFNICHWGKLNTDNCIKEIENIFKMENLEWKNPISEIK